MGESRLFPINFSPILKRTGVKPSLVHPRTQTNCNVKRDGVCQTPRLPGILPRSQALPTRLYSYTNLAFRALWSEY